MNFTHLTYVVALLCESENTKNVILHWNITKENCIRCIIASSKWTKVIMCLKFTYLGCYTAICVWNKDSWHRRPAKTLDANFKLGLTWTYAAIDQWRYHLRSCVCACVRACVCVCVCVWWTLWTHALAIMFIYMIHQNMLWKCQCNLHDAFNGYFVVIIKSWRCVHMDFWCFDFDDVV